MALSFSTRVQLLEPELSTCHHRGPSCSGEGQGWVPENSETFRCLYRRVCSCTPPDPSVHLPRPQAAALSPISSLLLRPLGPGQQREVRCRSPAASSLSLASGHGWLEIWPSRAGRSLDNSSPGYLFSVFDQSAFRREAEGFVGVGREVLGWPWPLLPSQLVCVPHSAKQKLCYLANPTILSRAVLTMRGAHLSPQRLAK